MGLFSKSKQEVFSLPEKYNKDFIYSVSTWTTEVKLNTKIVVPEGWWCMFVAKDKPCDILESGEHIITLDKIPKLTKLLKLQKPVTKIKHGKQEKVYRDSFKSFVYFVNKTAVENLAWQTDNIVLKKKNAKKEDKKRFDVILSGVTNLRCVAPDSMMKFYLYEWAKVDSFKAKNRVCEFVGEVVYDVVRKKRSLAPQEIDDMKGFSASISGDVQKEFTKFGMELEGFEVTKVIFDRDVAASLLQEKMENDLSSDEINELGAEISVQDDATVAEKQSKKSTKTTKNTKKAKKPEILDMTEGVGESKKEGDNVQATESQNETKTKESVTETEELPKIPLKSKNTKKEKKA